MHGERADEIMRTIHEYIRTVKASARTGARTGTLSGNRNIIELDPDGFPRAPSPGSWENIRKAELEKLFRSYVTHHYGIFDQFLKDAGEFTLIFFRPCIRR
jgi:hypothetical protein